MKNDIKLSSSLTKMCTINAVTQAGQHNGMVVAHRCADAGVNKN